MNMCDNVRFDLYRDASWQFTQLKIFGILFLILFLLKITYIAKELLSKDKSMQLIAMFLTCAVC